MGPLVRIKGADGRTYIVARGVREAAADFLQRCKDVMRGERSGDGLSWTSTCSLDGQRIELTITVPCPAGSTSAECQAALDELIQAVCDDPDFECEECP